MADRHDYLEAARETDAALKLCHDAYLSLSGGVVSDDVAIDVACSVLEAGRAVALAIREASVRADYVARDLAAR